MAISPNQHAHSFLMLPKYIDVATLDLSRSKMIVWGLRGTAGGNTLCVCVCFLLKDHFISLFSSSQPVDRETEDALRGSLLYQHIVICAALWLLLHCDYITAALWLYQVKCQRRDKVTLQHLLKVGMWFTSLQWNRIFLFWGQENTN